MQCPDCGHTGHLEMCRASIGYERTIGTRQCYCPSSMEVHTVDVPVWSAKSKAPGGLHTLTVVTETLVNGFTLGDYLFTMVGGFGGTQ